MTGILSLLLNTGSVLREGSTNCAEHQANTRHMQEKYYLYARTLMQAILQRFPMVKVYCKPISTGVEDYKKSFRLKEDSPLTIESYRPEMRIGAFEVQLCKAEEGKKTVELLHSKLGSRVWPRINSILNRISKHVPHTRINVKVYTTADEANDKPLKDIKVLLKENNEKIQEMTQNFDESLYVLDQQKKASMQQRPSATQHSMRLPPIEKPQTSAGQRAHTARPMTARPMTTASLVSVQSTTAL